MEMAYVHFAMLRKLQGIPVWCTSSRDSPLKGTVKPAPYPGLASAAYVCLDSTLATLLRV